MDGRMKYKASGENIRVGDCVLIEDDAEGVVVFDFDDRGVYSRI
jgi:hypothetical protein